MRWQTVFDRSASRHRVPVRYLLFAVTPTTDPRGSFDGAPEWPLDISPELVSMKPEGAFDPLVQAATGDAASQLRSLRTAFLGGEFGLRDEEVLIPIEQPDGSRFRLVVRDVVEFETAAGQPFVPWVDLQQLPAFLQ